MQHTLVHRGQSHTSHRWGAYEGAMVDLDESVASVWAATGSSVMADLDRYHWYEATASDLHEWVDAGQTRRTVRWMSATALVNAFDFDLGVNPWSVEEAHWLQVGDDLVFRLVQSPNTGHWIVFKTEKVNVDAKRASVLTGRSLKHRHGGYTVLEPKAALDLGRWIDDDEAISHARAWAAEVRQDRLDRWDGLATDDDDLDSARWVREYQANERREALVSEGPEQPVDPFLLLHEERAVVTM